MKIDWSPPLTLCWCGFTYHGVNYVQPYLNTLADTINEMHLRTHQTEAYIAVLNKRRETAQRLIDSLPPLDFDHNIIAGNDEGR